MKVLKCHRCIILMLSKCTDSYLGKTVWTISPFCFLSLIAKHPAWIIEVTRGATFNPSPRRLLTDMQKLLSYELASP